MKISTRVLAGFKKAARGNCLSDGISYNDNYNIDKFGITFAQFQAVLRVTEAMLGGEYLQATHTNVNKFLAGEKVHLTRIDPKLLEVVKAAFNK